MHASQYLGSNRPRLLEAVTTTNAGVADAIEKETEEKQRTRERKAVVLDRRHC